jgi:hypothetical protein
MLTGRSRRRRDGKAAEAALRAVVASVDAGRYVERSTRAVGDYVDE